ncbi:MAG: DUF1524 domain-containing protein [Quadrisphaera sp.]
MARRSTTPVARSAALTLATAGLAAVVVALAGAAGAVPPKQAASSTSTTRPVAAATATGTPSPSSTGSLTALQALGQVTVKGRAPKTGYTRDQFGAAWADVDQNGCDTRNDVLKRDMTAVTYVTGTRSCVVYAGSLADLYSGRTITFQRGVKTSSAVQIDHVIPLSDAWQKGAQGWSTARRTAFANDPLNLLAADGPLNGAKGDSDAATWLPPNKAFRCAYVARQVAVKLKYGVWMTSAERDASRTVLTTCPTEPLPTSAAAPKPTPASSGGTTATLKPAAVPTSTAKPTSSSKPTAKPTSSSKPTSTAKPTAKPTSSSKPTSTAKPTVKPTGTAKPTAKVSYKNCAAVRAAGKAPIRKGDPGWSTAFDRDGDGIGCDR